MAMHEKKITKVQVSYTCDVCNKKADGNWYSTECTNGEISAEYFLPIDMCKEHASMYSSLLFTLDNPSLYMKERYEGFSSQQKENLIAALKQFEEAQ